MHGFVVTMYASTLGMWTGIAVTFSNSSQHLSHHDITIFAFRCMKYSNCSGFVKFIHASSVMTPTWEHSIHMFFDLSFSLRFLGYAHSPSGVCVENDLTPHMYSSLNRRMNRFVAMSLCITINCLMRGL